MSDYPSPQEQWEQAHQTREELRRNDAPPLAGWLRVVEYVDCCPTCPGAPILEGRENAPRLYCQCGYTWTNPRVTP